MGLRNFEQAFLDILFIYHILILQKKVRMTNDWTYLIRGQSRAFSVTSFPDFWLDIARFYIIIVTNSHFSLGNASKLPFSYIFSEQLNISLIGYRKEENCVFKCMDVFHFEGLVFQCISANALKGNLNVLQFNLMSILQPNPNITIIINNVYLSMK